MYIFIEIFKMCACLFENVFKKIRNIFTNRKMEKLGREKKKNPKRKKNRKLKNKNQRKHKRKKSRKNQTNR